ncbi:MAG: nucleotide exchange factor GrpE [Hyphomicrobium zavarzinii]|jgi:molecular chaperone GrpE|uniref:nucleotide exchange factor GrpE n=1 Tax=Hyphomicrobium TaxID=81 RepID=UPI000361C9EA|nr:MULTISPECIES: nucleotide exchange factor GrpE [Hyphomicrobium]MBL8847913.1 nucleotide exchange factor GrpE [Hyphomicrobium zavarzinii]WBT39106.1 nucleotide exchange factor GrpE [Hyphomicrobium sp. DMF-1]HML43855.1 nucleotide exchange factor GrpE [Hyphomicrobium zavarzinii]
MADETTNPNAASGAGEAPSDAPANAAEEVLRLGAEVDTLKGQVSDLTDRLLRAHAEMDNVRKRLEREREETAKYAITKFARDVVNVADNFERAIQAVPAGAADQDAALKALVEGVSMTEREFLNVLERNGVRRITPKGEPFNPHQHQAMMEMQNADVAPGTILEVYQSGYVIEDRVLRPAMVVVAKGGSKPSKAPAAEGADEAGGGDAPASEASPGSDTSV